MQQPSKDLHTTTAMFAFLNSNVNRCFGFVFSLELGEVLKSNEERMQKQLDELEHLKQNATVVRDEIQKQVREYSTCQG